MADDNLGRRIYDQDDAPKPPKTGFEAFKGTPLAIVLGIILGVGAAIIFMFTGVYYTCCFFMGYLLVALVLYYVPKLFGADKIKWQAIVAVLFLVGSTCVGALIVSPDAIRLNEFDNGSFSNEGFTDLKIVPSEDGNELIVSYVYESGHGKAMGIQEQRIQYIHFANVKAYDSVQSIHVQDGGEVPNNDGKSTYTIHMKASVNEMYHFRLVQFKSADNNDVEKGTKAYLFEYKLTDSHKKEIIWLGNFYQTAIVTGVFLVVCILMFFMNRTLQQTRSRLEAEGRLYPQGYGRCKECGTMVLPGETCCRKCGAYVDIPDEMRVKKVDSFHCSECGAEVPGNSLTCPRCGAKFDEDDEVVIVDKDGKESETINVENTAEERPTEEKTEEKPVENKEEEKKE